MGVNREIFASEYVAYSALYTSTILCNKYVLTSLGFQFPTIFQAWQTLVGLFLMQMVSGFHLRGMILRDVLPWLPAMILYVGTIYSGSKALSQLPVPIFILGQGTGDVILLMCNQMMPSTINHFSFPLKLAGAVIASWSVLEGSWSMSLVWLAIHAICSGTYRSISYWYSTPYWPDSNLSIEQRQYLNYSFSLAVLLPSIFLLGHHVEAKSFRHFGTNVFYIGCICSGVFGWAVNKMWTRVFYHRMSEFKTLSTALAAKVTTLLISMHVFPHIHSWSIWIGISLSIIADVLQMIDASFETAEPLPSEEMHDVLISM